LDQLKPILEKIDNALSEKNKSILLAELIECISALEVIEPKSSEICHLLGYCWYLHPGRLESLEVQEKVNFWLNKSISKDPGYSLSLLYLAHNFYDCKKYEKAIEFLSKITNPLSDYMQLKMKELKLCCEINISGLENSLENIQWFGSDLKFVQDKTLIAPFELHKVISKKVEASVELREKLASVLLQLDENGDLNNWFSSILMSHK